MFTYNFWKSIFQYLGTQLNFSTTYHPQIEGQTRRVNQVIKDMFLMYVIDKLSKWEYYLNFVEFAYNNGHQTSLKISPFRAFYEKSYRTPVS